MDTRTTVRTSVVEPQLQIQKTVAEVTKDRVLTAAELAEVAAVVEKHGDGAAQKFLAEKYPDLALLVKASKQGMSFDDYQTTDLSGAPVRNAIALHDNNTIDEMVRADATARASLLKDRYSFDCRKSEASTVEASIRRIASDHGVGPKDIQVWIERGFFGAKVTVAATAPRTFWKSFEDNIYLPYLRSNGEIWPW